MADLTRRLFMKVGSLAGAAFAGATGMVKLGVPDARAADKEGGENREYPLLIAITHSGTSYDGTCAQTLTEQCIASIWGMPEQQAKHECVVITPRYERITMNDYWEHTADVENTYRLVESMLANTWNFGNPNLADRRD